MNMENTAVIIMRPRSTHFGSLPNGLRSTRARFLSMLYLQAAEARKKPPKKSMIIGLANVAMMSLNLSGSTPSTRNGIRAEFESVRIINTITNMEVDQIGNGWRIQKRAAITKIAMTRISRGFKAVSPTKPRASYGTKRAAMASTDAIMSLMSFAFVITSANLVIKLAFG